MAAPKLYHHLLGEWLDLGFNSGAEGGTHFAASVARSTVETVVHAQPRDREPFSIAGVDGEFVHDHGGRARPIEITGALRGTQTFRAAVMTQRDNWLANPSVVTFFDDDGTEYGQCELVAFEIAPKVRISNFGEFTVVGDEACWMMPYRIVLAQLEV